MSSKLTMDYPSPWLVQLMPMELQSSLVHTASPSLTAPSPPSTGLLMPMVSVLSLPFSLSPLSTPTPFLNMFRNRSTSPMLNKQLVWFGMNLMVDGYKSNIDPNLLRRLTIMINSKDFYKNSISLSYNIH